ncbi:MAG: ATP-binding protein [Thermoplasmatota archaeon]|nr:ATP-binding protein [Candidatus Thermoplasmatota archaeon]
MLEMDNPFKFGGLVTGKDFADRENEMDEILREVRSGTNIVMFSPRRMGKSSLMAELMHRHGAEFLFVYVDLYGITTKTRMVEVFMSALVSSVYGTVKKVAAGIKDVIKGSRLRLVINEKGEPGVEFSVGEPSVPEIQDMLDIPEEIARKRGKRIVIVFDEFQEIGSLDGVSLLKAMRSRIQAHRHVSYIFAGSKRHMLMSIFEEREGAFFKSAKPLELGPIPRADFERFLVDRFSAAGGRLEHEAARAIVETGGGNSYYVQQIAHELFNISTRPKWPGDVESAVATTLAHQSPAFQFLWDSIKSRTQRRYLMAVAREGKTMSRSALIERYGLRSASHVQRAIKQLDARGITEGGVIVDPMLALWLRGLTERKS